MIDSKDNTGRFDKASIRNSPLVDACIEEISRMLSPFAAVPRDARLKRRANRWNIAVGFGEKRVGAVRFSFETTDELPVHFDIDLADLRRRGRPYLDEGLQALERGLMESRRRRRQATRIEVRDATPVPASGDEIPRIIARSDKKDSTQ
jgi:hypothetical protein